MEDSLRTRYPRYFAFEDLMAPEERVVAGYRRTVAGGTPVDFTHSHRTPGLPVDTVRVTVGGEHLDLSLDAWIGQLEAAKGYILAWVSARVHLEGAKLTASRGKPDPYWQHLVREANPGRQ